MRLRLDVLVIAAAMQVTGTLSARLHAQALPAPTRNTVIVGRDTLALWSRSAPHPRGVILLIHGRTWSALPDFDLQVPGEQKSVLRSLQQRGYAAYALDLPGYGESPRDSSGWLTPNRAAHDVIEVLAWLHGRHPKLPVPVLVGWSYGSLVSHLALQQSPSSASAVVLYGFPRSSARMSAMAAAPATPLRETNTAKNAASDFIAPNAISQRAIDTYVAAALKADPVRSDWNELKEWLDIAPEKLTIPTLLLQGELDPYAPINDAADEFVRLGSSDRQWVILPGVDHAALLEDSHAAFIAAICDFIERRIRQPRATSPQ